MFQYNDPHSYRSYYPIKVERPVRISRVKSYPSEVRLCNGFEKFWNWINKNDDCTKREEAYKHGGTEEMFELGKKITFIDPTKDIPSQVKAAPPLSQPTSTAPTSDTYNFNLFGKEIKLPKNLIYPAIGIVLFIILIIALRSR